MNYPNVVRLCAAFAKRGRHVARRPERMRRRAAALVPFLPDVAECGARMLIAVSSAVSATIATRATASASATPTCTSAQVRLLVRSVMGLRSLRLIKL